MIFLIARKPFDTRGPEFFGMGKGIATQSFSIQRPRKEGRKTLSVVFGMRMGTGVRQMRVLRRQL